MPDAHGEDGEIVHEGWLLKSRESMMKLPFIRVSRVFILVRVEYLVLKLIVDYRI